MGAFLWINPEAKTLSEMIRALRAQGFPIDIAHSTVHGLVQLAVIPFDGIIVGSRLADLPASTVLRLLRFLSPHSAILVLQVQDAGLTVCEVSSVGEIVSRSGDDVRPLISGCGRIVDRYPSMLVPWLLEVSSEVSCKVREEPGHCLAAAGFAGVPSLREQAVGELIGVVCDGELGVRQFVASAVLLRCVQEDTAQARQRLILVKASLLRENRDAYGTIARTVLERLSASFRTHASSTEAEVARDIGIHPAHLGRILQRSTGFRFREWRSTIMVQYAIQQLTTGEQIKSAAYNAGFGHPTQFARECRRLTGLSPVELRQAWRPSASSKAPARPGSTVVCWR
jgi:AraC-like DNA-binding protein